MTMYMTKKPTIALAAALVAGILANIDEAAAGGGVRLNFGGPLGSFVASPYSSGYGHRHAYKPSYGGHHAYGRPAPRKPVVAASRKSDETRAIKARKKVETAKSEKAGNKDGSAVQQVATNAVPLDAAAAPPAPVIAAKVEETTATAVTAGSIAPTAATLVPTAAAGAAEKPAAEAAPAAEAKPQKAKAKTAEKKNDCRRFIPAAGVTISVRCGS